MNTKWKCRDVDGDYVCVFFFCSYVFSVYFIVIIITGTGTGWLADWLLEQIFATILHTAHGLTVSKQ